MNIQYQNYFEEAEELFFRCEDGNNLDKAEALLRRLSQNTEEPSILARTYGELAQAKFWRYEYAPADERLAIAEEGVKIAKYALEYDKNNLQANAWAAAMMGLHGLEMGILSSLFYIEQIRECAERVVILDEAYHSAIAHQILGDLYRLAPPKPIGVRDKKKALSHLLRAKELAPECPQAKIRLASFYITVRKYDLAKEEIDFVLNQDIKERGPVYAAKCKKNALDLSNKIG